MASREFHRPRSARALEHGWRRHKLGIERLEDRRLLAVYAVSPDLQISCLDPRDGAPGAARSVVFVESSVADEYSLLQGLSAGADAVLLDSAGDGLREMAAFLDGRHDLAAIHVVAHGAAGMVELGTAVLTDSSLDSYATELAIIGSALAPGGELALWSCDVAAGAAGQSFVLDLAAATGVEVAAADHKIGSAALGGDWRLNVLSSGAGVQSPFTAQIQTDFQGILGTWSNAASMSAGRVGPAAALLPNGKVLVVGGGSDSSTILTSAEMYDPATNTWTGAGSMAVPRKWPTATLLGNGKVLVAGGLTAPFTVATNSAQLYDPSTNTWSSAGSLTAARYLHTATLLGDGTVLVTGGQSSGNSLSTAEIYNPLSNTWSVVSQPMSTPRSLHTATLLNNGKVFLAAGNGGGGTHLNSAELYDPATHTFSAAASMSVARYEHTATLLTNGNVVVAGSHSFIGTTAAELYNPGTNTWSSAGSISDVRTNATATRLGNGKVLLVGGQNLGGLQSSAELYDPILNSWSSTASMAQARYYHAATLLPNGNVLIAGGGTTNLVGLNTAELYVPFSLSQSTVTVGSSSIQSGGTTTVTLTVRDANGVQDTSGGWTVAFGLGSGTSSGTFSSVTDLGNGTYRSTFTGTTAGTARTITATIAGQSVFSTLPTITVTPGPVSLSQSTVSVSPSSIASGSTSTVTLTAKDAAGNQLTSGGLSVAFGLGSGTSSGTFSGVTDLGNGTYRATFTGTTAGTARTITATIGGSSVTSSLPTITVTPGPVSLSQSTVSVSPSSIASGSTSTVTLTAKDAAGNQLTSGGLSVAFGLGAGTSSGTFSGVTDLGNGTYRVTFTGTTAGTARTITATIGGSSVTSTLPTITVTPGPVNLSQSTVSVSPASIASGSTSTVTLTARDAAGNQLTSGGLSVAFGLGSGTSSGTFSGVTDLGNGTYRVTFTGTTAGTARTITATIGGSSVTSTLPTITVTPGPLSLSQSTVIVSPSSIASGSTSTVTLTARDAAGNQLTSGGLSVAFGLGSGTSSGTLSGVTDLGNGTYRATFTGTTAGTARTITATIGGQAVTSTLPTITVIPLRVTSLVATATGFTVQFNSDLDVSVLNLYDQGGALGVADLTLTGSLTGAVRGSVVVDPGLRKITFIKSGGVLAAETYTVNLLSGTNAFKDTQGNLLDGNSDGNGGDDFAGNFTISTPATSAVTMSIPDFTRGYGQAVNVPASATTGIPVAISNAQGVSSANFTLTYNPTLLSVSAVTLGAGITGTLAANTSTPGVLIVSVTSAAGLSGAAGSQALVHLTATVPGAAPYTSKHVLDLQSLQILDTSGPTPLPAIDDDGIHIVAYFGDTSGSQTYNAPDATLAQRVIVGPNTGFSAYQLADPGLIADISGNGTIAANDVTLIQRAIVGTATTQIPPHPGLNVTASGGPDPLVYIPQDLSGAVGLTVSVPVQLLVTETTGITLAGADLAIAYDPTTLALTDAQVGTLLVGFGLNANTSTPGLIRLSLAGASLDLPHGAAGTLATLNFTILAGAGTSSSINLLASSASLHTALYDDLGRAFTLLPAPTDAEDDAVDGSIAILPERSRPSATSRAQAVDAALGEEIDADWIA